MDKYQQYALLRTNPATNCEMLVHLFHIPYRLSVGAQSPDFFRLLYVFFFQ